MLMNENVRHSLFVMVGVGFFLAVVLMVLFPVTNASSEINVTRDGVAIEGYDTVAYFTQRQPVKGSPEYSHRWKDAVWHFANAEHRDLFANNPEKFAPQWGGY